MSQPQRKEEGALAIREMRIEDIPAVGELAQRIWRAYYPAIISPAQVEYMLDLMYSPKSLEKQLADGHRFFLLEQGGALLGYASAEPKESGRWHLHKLYVDQATARRGLGSRLLKHLEEALRPKALTLTVNRHNVRAINFYFKEGFSIERVLDAKIGGGFVMEDFLMRRDR